MTKVFWASLAAVATLFALAARLFGLPVAIILVALPPIFTVIFDLLQVKHSLGRVYPFLWRARPVAEELRPEVQQYFIESNTSGKPASRNDRTWAYASGKLEPTDISFGTEKEYNQPGQIHIRHVGFPLADSEVLSLAPLVLGPKREYPAFLFGRFGVSDMSFGSLFQRAKQAITTGAAQAGAPVCLGEGGPTPYDFSGVYIKVDLADRINWIIRHYLLGRKKREWRNEPFPVSGYMGG
ncbi:MAG: glutamate synthase-related protein, partial [Terriglobales bacterium]